MGVRGGGVGKRIFCCVTMKFTLSPSRLCRILMIPASLAVDWSPIRFPLKKSNKLIFPEFSTTPPQVINNCWYPTEYHAPSHSCIFLVFKYQGYSIFFPILGRKCYLHSKMFIMQLRTNLFAKARRMKPGKGMYLNLRISLKGNLLKTFFLFLFFCNYPLGGLSQCCLLLRAEQ